MIKSISNRKNLTDRNIGSERSAEQLADIIDKRQGLNERGAALSNYFDDIFPPRISSNFGNFWRDCLKYYSIISLHPCDKSDYLTDNCHLV